MKKSGFVKEDDFQAHKDKDWRVAHGIWPNIRAVVGPVGPKGSLGLAGVTGPTGPAGDTGPQGATGAVGPTGPTGVEGAQGNIGESGPIGPTGPTGVEGPQGNIGESGPIGPTGPTGVEGAQGNIGESGPIGPTGPTGVEGPQGSAGESGVGAAIVDPDCVLYLPIIQGSGNKIYDKSGKGNDGTLYPTPVPISACDATDDWTGTSLSIDTSDKKEGTGSLKNNVASPEIDATYNTTYNPTGSWDWSAKKHILFWLKCDRASTAFSRARLYIYDTLGNWRRWGLTFSEGEWTTFKLLLSTGDAESETPPDLALIDNTFLHFKAKDTTPFYKKIDDLRIDDRPQWAASAVSGKCLDFDGVDDKVALLASQDFAQEKMTFSAWINANNFAQYRGLIYIQQDEKLNYLIVRGTGTGLLLLIEDGNVMKVSMNTAALSTSTWIHVAFVQDGTGWKFYLDGELATFTGTNSEYCTDHLTINNVDIGLSGWTEKYWDGLIDEVRIYNRALTEDEIGFLYHQIYLTGAQGEQGPTGISGVQGPQGITGPSGPQGPTGISGVKGEQGETGVTGDQGETGLKGVKGEQGETGVTGDQGETGLKGVKGDQGETGVTGDQGAKGDKGDKGDKGETGDKGVQGEGAERFEEIFDGLNTADINGQGSYSDPNFDAWVTNNIGAGNTCEVVVEAGDDKILRLTDGATVGTAKCYVQAAAGYEHVEGILTVKLRSSRTDRESNFQVCSGATPRFSILFANDGNIKLWNGTGYITLQAYAANTWYAIRLHFSLSGAGVVAFVDDVFRTRQIITVPTYINRLLFFTDPAAASYTFDVDDLVILNLTVRL